MLNPFDEPSFLALAPDLQDFVTHLHASEGKDLSGAAGLLGVSVEAAREILARKDVAAAIEDLSIRVAGAKAAPPPRDQRSGWQKERDAKFATEGQRAWNRKGGRPPAIDPAKFRSALLAGQTLGEAAAAAGSGATTKKDLGTIGSQYLVRHPELRADLLAAGWDPKAAWRKKIAERTPAKAPTVDPARSYIRANRAPRASVETRAPRPVANASALELTLNHRILEHLDRALATGLFGKSRAEAAERLLCLALSGLRGVGT